MRRQQQPEPPAANPEEVIAALVTELQRTLGDAITVEHDDSFGHARHVVMRANGTHGCPISIIYYYGEAIIELGPSFNGRWELEPNVVDMDFLDQLVRGVVFGGATEVTAPGRGRVLVELPDGTNVRSTSVLAGRGCLPLPGWPRWGRRRQYSAYGDNSG